ncbi:cobaltochelatase subunit CobN [Phocaeicola vulgatus]|uniref:cobaltochelatase subunit CobN n=1 Tax=Phocaeicola vulgatus TaxID=821 RepID=UPI001F3EFD08|nr:cobaltochelatase subunit CobN [Phocaeicola vulgatus]MCG0159673.1 cobaltochelatase subunit CobN [Phocaeicola vulgatus]MCG0302297.1 cobaltochelatase subunit CobN [Phocaeicola vulgatus]
MKKLQLLKIAGGVFVVSAALTGAWNLWFSSTQVGFVNYQVINLGQISKANHNSFIKISEISTDELDDLDTYDMVFINAMGLRITEEQRNMIQHAAQNGLPVLTTAATNPLNNIVSVDEAVADTLKAYLGNGGRKNYASMLDYVRKYVDKKWMWTDEPLPVARRVVHQFYHADPENPDSEEVGFTHVSQYRNFLKTHGLFKEKAPAVVITGQMGQPAELVSALEKSGNVVYPVNDFKGLIASHAIDSINPSLVIYMAHGRMGDYAVDYLKQQNIPLFTPLNVNRLIDAWEKDKMGMNGGFMAQSIVTPEIDGAIRPYALFGHYMDEEGLQHAFAIPERLDVFVETVNNYIELQQKPNSEKKVAIYYYKGAGQNALTAGGMEVIPSLYNLLTRLKAEGYTVKNLPASAQELGVMIQRQGAVFGTYAEGAMAEFMKHAQPAIVTKDAYEGWVKKALRPDKYNEILASDGEFPGSYLTTDNGALAVPRIDLGNIVLLPQNAAGKGDNSFKILHGTEVAPPHAYVASYLWSQYGFGADALIHFGTHGSLEFTPGKQVALCHDDWPDRLIGALPHFYIYSIANVGEGVIAKRRAYAGLQSYLTPPFMESSLRGTYRKLSEAIKVYNQTDPQQVDSRQQASFAVKRLAVAMGIHRDLGLDSVLTVPYTEDDIVRIDNFAEELATEKITGQLYTMGVPYEADRITSSVYAMTVDPVAYSLLALDKIRGKAVTDAERKKSLFTARYLSPARSLVARILAGQVVADDALVCQVTGITSEQLEKARLIDRSLQVPQGMMAMMVGGGKPATRPKAENGRGDEAKHLGKPSTAMMKAAMKGKPTYTKAEINLAQAVLEVERTILNVHRYKAALLQSPEQEIRSLLNALDRGYTAPSPGGDPIANPNTLPTGRNLFAINAEATPSESAWEKGKKLAENTIEMYRKRHNDSIPRKVSYTLWSGEFIETEGATVAQVLYMLGVEPIRDAFGRVIDLRLIPSEELGRPRIDVVVQTSGQLRDIAASRLFLINRAVEMAAAAKDQFENHVAEGVIAAERALTEKGISPKEARELSAYRVFGGVNGSYGTGIQGMVQKGDRWENESEIADVYLNNMGAFYGSEKDWETVKQFAFEAALVNTDAVVQPRQSNTWGALSLDHVYEFMGGMNLAVRHVTGKDPDAYLSDYRNRNNVRMQEVKEAIGVESRTTIFNPAYIREKMKGEAGAAATFAEIVQNTYGWNVMKPKAVDKELWDEIYNIYVKDKFGLGLQAYFEKQNPAALEEITAVMMETARKGMWKASEQQLADIAQLHTQLIAKYKPSCSGFVCDNAKLRDFIASKTDAASAVSYRKDITAIREQMVEGTDKGMVMKKEQVNTQTDETTNVLSNTVVVCVVLVLVVALILLVRRRHKHLND